VKHPTFNKKPAGFIIVIDGEVMANVGKKGVIKDERVATRLCRYLQIRMPESNVDLFGVFTR
jgi:hypothetical protein